MLGDRVLLLIIMFWLCIINHDKVYPGKIVTIGPTSAEIDYMEEFGCSAETWKWPARTDCATYLL